MALGSTAAVFSLRLKRKILVTNLDGSRTGFIVKDSQQIGLHRIQLLLTQSSCSGSVVPVLLAVKVLGQT